MASQNKTRTDNPLMRFAFPVSMALLMCYGMELYNHLLMGMGLSVATLLSPFSELLPMAAAVVIIEQAVADGRWRPSWRASAITKGVSPMAWCSAL